MGGSMGVKNISIKDKVYELLKQSKREDESFSDVIEKLLTKREINLKEFYGCLKDSVVLD
ncbi:MAG: antitoxin VapB family protein, partial [Candidatus Odinarchaeia archaeon]